jgi:hypothetical protein
VSRFLSTAEGLATSTGVAILFSTTNANVLQTGGWFTSHAMLVAALSAGVFAGARVVGLGAGNLGLVIIAALVAGEAYNFSATAERIVVERENSAAPLKDAMAKHNSSLAKLKTAEGDQIDSVRLTLAKQAKVEADKAADAEAHDGGCKSVCRMKQAEADKAQTELNAALTEAQQMHDAAIDAAKADVAANPLPASATPLADRLNIPAWVLDLVMAGLLSVGANGLAGTLIAFGSSSTSDEAEIVPVPVSSTSSEPNGTPPGKRTRSPRQMQANAIARELREKGVKPEFHIVRSEFRNRYGEEPPKVTIHRACA